MRYSTRRRPLLAFPAMALALLWACGGSSTSTTTVTPPTTQATPPPASVVSRGSFALPVNFVGGDVFTTEGTGTLDATVDYTFNDSRMVVWIARGRCTADQFNAESCDFVASSFAGSRPRKVSVTGIGAGTYTFIVGNAGPRDESISYQVVFTPSVAGAPVRSESTSRSAAPWTAPLRIRP
jgi:hypothetical protein